METTFYIEIIRAVWRELINWRSSVMVVFLIAMFALLVVGMFWPERYETDTMLYADSTNIIEPLLAGRAEVTEIDRSKEARELIYTRRILMQVATSTGLLDPNAEVEIQEKVIGRLRNKISINNEGKNYFRVTYANENQDSSFRILNAVVDAFIKDSSASRRQESREAYEFIDQQVESYKRQLLLAEGKLKEFKSKNLDGSETSVNARINQLRLQIEELKLTVGEIEAREKSIKSQLKNESAYLDNRNKVDEQREKLKNLQSSLDNLRLSYQETYPDIISLKEQIAAQKLVIEAMQGDGYVGSSASSDALENPLYEELRKRQAETQVDLRSQKNRLSALKRMLTEEYERAERVASREADLAELVRDYDVTREIYEEMLGRKEKARLSMTLDIEGQGVSYKIQEPAVYPLQPSGIRFIHFAFVAPIFSLLLSIGLIVIYVLLDPRVRSPSQLMNNLPGDIELLVVVPHVNTALTKRLWRSDMLIMLSVMFFASIIYVALILSRLKGLI